MAVQLKATEEYEKYEKRVAIPSEMRDNRLFCLNYHIVFPPQMQNLCYNYIREQNIYMKVFALLRLF